MTLKGIRMLPTLAALLAILLTIALGNWQTRRAAEKQALQAERDRALLLAPIRLDAAALAAPEPLPGRRVIAEGEFLERYTVFVDNRAYRGQAGFHVVTPFAPADGSTPVLVLRGWTAQDPADRGRVPSVNRVSARVRIEALAQADLDQVLELSKPPAPGPDDRLWQNASIAAVSRWSGLALAPVVLRQTGELSPDEVAGRAAPDELAARSLIRDWPSPGMGVDKHRAYAFQWYSMAATVSILWLYVFWRSRRTQP